MKNKLLLFIILFGVIAGGYIGYGFSHSGIHDKKQVLADQTVAQKKVISVTPTVAPGIPETITIPKIHVNTKIESVGMDSKGRMGVPTNPFDTAWYSPGFKPGMNGSAVIDGHLDLVTGAPAVFWNLKLLNIGDTIIVMENNGKKYTFAVSQITKYPYNNFPINQVFAATNVPMLNLITCNGIWDHTSRNYSDRLVIYSKLIAEN